MPTRSGTLAAIFALLGSKKWMTRDGRAGTCVRGVGAPTASGPEEVLGAAHGRQRSNGLAARVMTTVTRATDEGGITRVAM